MMLANKQMANAVDFAAALVFGAAVAFAASALANGALAALAAPVAFLLAYIGLGRVDSDRPYRLPPFELQPIEAARHEDGESVHPVDRPGADRDEAGDASGTLSKALAELKRSLR